MSYEKAMKHHRNVRKCRKQANNHFGFDTGSGHWPSGRAHPYMGRIMEIRDWFPDRNRGTAEERKLCRECIRESIAAAREAVAAMVAAQRA